MNDSGNARESGLPSQLLALFPLLLAQLRRLKQAMVNRTGRAKARRMVLIETLELGNRRQLFLVACDEQRFLVGAGGDRIGTVAAMAGATSVVGSGESSVPAGTQQIESGRPSARRLEPRWLHRSSGEAAGAHGLQLIRRSSESSRLAGMPKGAEAGRSQ